MNKIDFHVHINSSISEEQTISYFTDMCKRYDYSGVGMMSISRGSSHGDDLQCDQRALSLKRKMPGSFAFCSLDHTQDFVRQTKEKMAQGFDGVKIIEGKPSIYRLYRYGLDCPRFDAFFAYAEQEQIPIMLHNCDPARNWDINKADERAIQKGWYYDETIPPQSYFYEALETVLKRHPNLRMAIAHMGFYADRLDKARGLLNACPNLYLDLTPALIIYRELSENPGTAQFFADFSDRLIYGTDADNYLEGFARDYNDKKVRVITAFLEGTTEAEVEGVPIRSLHLPEETLKKIYAENALAFIKKI